MTADGKGPGGSGDAEPLEIDSNSASISKIVQVPQPRRRLPNRRASESFDFECGGLRYTCTYSRFADGCIGEIFLSNHKSNSGADVNARDAAIATSFALQYGADIGAIRRALCRNENGSASGPLGAALDIIAKEGGGR
jgi:hypothetical protein